MVVVPCARRYANTSFRLEKLVLRIAADAALAEAALLFVCSVSK